MTENAENPFDKALEMVGNDGPYQKRFNIFFGYFLQLAVMMPSLNIIMALAAPDHWCYVPGRADTNFTLDQWKSITIPKANNTQGINTFSTCTMFNTTSTDAQIIGCQHGWEFDKTWYLSTVVAQENWVCDRELHVTTILAFSKIGDFMGTFIFGQLSDIIGRKLTFYITALILFLGRITSVFTSSYVWIFAFCTLVGNLATPLVFQSPLTIAMEISSGENRAMVLTFQALGATSAMCLLSIIYWFFRDWIPFMLASTIPCGLYLFTYKWLVESPRWLFSRRKYSKCVKELKKIAKVNKRDVTDISLMLRNYEQAEEKTYGFMSLFSSWTLTKKTILLSVLWIEVNLVYFTLIMNMSNLGGNPFLNYFFQGVAELPASILGKIFCNTMGRRWCHRYGFLAAGLSSILMALLINSTQLQWISSIVVILLKFFTTFAFYALNVHTIEIFPTCVRQTGMSFCVITSSAVCIAVPYIVYLGTSVNLSYPYVILASISALGVLTGLLLSETLNKPLLETLRDVKRSKRDNIISSNNSEQVKLTKMEASNGESKENCA